MSGWVSSENVFVAPTRKGETLPKLADRSTEKRTFLCPRGRRIFLHKSLLSGGTKVRNWAAMLSQIREKLNTPTDQEQLFRLKRMGKSPHSNPLLRDLAL